MLRRPGRNGVQHRGEAFAHLHEVSHGPALVGGDGEVRGVVGERPRLVDGAARHVQHIAHLRSAMQLRVLRQAVRC